MQPPSPYDIQAATEAQSAQDQFSIFVICVLGSVVIAVGSLCFFIGRVGSKSPRRSLFALFLAPGMFGALQGAVVFIFDLYGRRVYPDIGQAIVEGFGMLSAIYLASAFVGFIVGRKFRGEAYNGGD